MIKVTPGHSFEDYEIGKRHNLPIVNVIDKQGRLTEIAGRYAGMKVMEAREAMLPELREKGLLVREEEYVHKVPVCERCKSVVEPIISEEWFVKVDELAKEAIISINKKEVKFLPPEYAKILVKWLKNMHDWCISRSLWWGHRIPVWYLGNEKKVSLESPGPGWVQDEQVLDTWFSSGLWPLSTLGFPEKTTKFERYFPWDFEISAPEIKYLWIARMIMISKYFTGKAPFKTMFFHGMLRDLQGRKFSKSLGNGIEPQYLIDKWGVDATRMALYSYSIAGRDGRVSKASLDERGKNYRNFATKLRNISKFILDLKPERHNREIQLTHPQDNKIMAEFGKLTSDVTRHLDNLDLHLATDAIYEFVWHKFADVYIESTKSRRIDAQPILEHVLKQVLILLHPFMPFLTEEIYQSLDVKRESIMLEQWPLSEGR